MSDESQPPEEADDATLVRRCAAGSGPAWAALVRRFQRIVYTVPRRAGLSEADAADVFQFTFASLYERIHRIDQPQAIQAWLVTTAKRETLRLLQASVRFRAAPAARDQDGDPLDPLDRVPDPGPLPPEQLEALQLQDRARRAVKRLDSRTRTMIELMYLQDPALANREIAQRLGLAEGSIGPYRARCLDKLRAAMAQLD
jgi:RNA polymerase sigma factor (sigma-70 family)